MEPPYNKKEGLFVKSVAEEIVDIILEETPEKLVEDAWWWERSRGMEIVLASRRPALEDESYLLEMVETNNKLRHLRLDGANYSWLNFETRCTLR